MKKFSIIFLVLSAFMLFALNLPAAEKYDPKLPRKIENLVKQLEDKSVKKRQTATKELIRIGKPAVTEICFALNNSDNRFAKMCCADALGAIGDVSAVPSLIRALTDQKSRVRAFSARALGELGDASAVKSLIKVVKKDDASIARAFAATALGKLGDREAVSTLINALTRDEASEVKIASAGALAMLKDITGVSPLCEALLDDRD
ncbi:MAG: HEAT repeat domain-containing protein, partial [Candidatus Omnitrophota bacterium]|nr:HEAT repeat domain-containing protein [Candidatus Omnitrophota bacterium]